jgi:glycosyltransferase involved in cell wall biosynthesis
LKKTTRTVLSLYNLRPLRIGSVETFARELSLQLGQRGWNSVLCFTQQPEGAVWRFLTLPNVTTAEFSGLSRFSWHSVQQLAGIIRQHRPRILHMHFTRLNGPYPWLARALGVERVFVTDHDSRPAFSKPARAAMWKRLAAALVSRPVSAVISVSDYGRRALADADLLPARKIRRIYNGVDLSHPILDSASAARFRRDFSIPAHRSIVLQVSWIIPEKGIEDLLEAARLVTAKNSAVQFVMVGDGAHRSAFMRLGVELGLGDHVTWTGVIEESLGPAYSAADIVCQASRWDEVFGATIAEAMSYARPVIGTRVGGIPEVIRHGETGFLVPRGDPAALAEKISLLLEDRDLRERLGQAGRRSAEEKFDLRKNVKELLQLYGVT